MAASDTAAEDSVVVTGVSWSVSPATINQTLTIYVTVAETRRARQSGEVQSGED